MQKSFYLHALLLSLVLCAGPGHTLAKNNDPITAGWIMENVTKQSPRLFYDKATESKLIKAIHNQPNTFMANYYALIKEYATGILEKPPLSHELTGMRLLGVSREAMKRISALSLVYRVEQSPDHLQRLQEEIETVCHFSDWNPSHFLDVAEMCMAVSTGIDWCGEALPAETLSLAKEAIVEKAMKPGFDPEYTWWVNAHHNWNQVCHGGLSAGAIVIARDKPALAARVISRAVEKLPLALEAYAPDGAYPEGPSYWGYGTFYNVLAIDMYETAFQTDFGLPNRPGFMESATYRLVVTSPTGAYFNYSDAGDSKTISLRTREILSWFATKTGDALYFDKENFARQVARSGQENASRASAYAMAWLARFEQEKASSLPTCWKAGGPNPIAIFRAAPGENTGFFLGVKGGSASVNHANMDVGSFVFDLHGVRWSVDPGNQSYHELENTLGTDNLWNMDQASPRWGLLTKGNLFHSTLTINRERHRVNGFAPIVAFDTAHQEKKVRLGLDEIFTDQLNGATRTFIKANEKTLRIEDILELSSHTRNITWAMITTANVYTRPEGAKLVQENKELIIEIIKPKGVHFSVISLDPPPLPYDKEIKNLKRLELFIPAHFFSKSRKQEIIVELKEK